MSARCGFNARSRPLLSAVAIPIALVLFAGWITSPSVAAGTPAATPSCNTQLAPSGVEIVGTGGTGLAIGVSAACSYTVVSADAFIVITSTGTASGNSTVTYTVLPNDGPTRKGRIAIGSRTFTVKQAKGTAPPVHKTAYDFDGDAKADISVFRPSSGTWFLQQSRDGLTATQFGLLGDVLVPGDYDGDGKADFAVYRPSSGTWFILRTQDGLITTQFGLGGDVPIVGSPLP